MGAEACPNLPGDGWPSAGVWHHDGTTTAQPCEEGGVFCPWEQTFSSGCFLLFPRKLLFSRTEAITFACVFSL